MIQLQLLSEAISPGLRDWIPLLRLQPHPDWWDEDHTLLYLRFYQNFMRMSVLGKLVTRLVMPSNLYIAHEDRRVVITQKPKTSGLKTGEILIQGDIPIIEYRKRRLALQKSSEQPEKVSV